MEQIVPIFFETKLILGFLHIEKEKAIKGLRKYTEEGSEDRCLDCDATKRISEILAYEIIKIIMKGKPKGLARDTGEPSETTEIVPLISRHSVRIRQIL